jgi:integrase
LLEPIWARLDTPTAKLFARVPAADTLQQDLSRASLARQDEQGRWLDFHSLRYTFCTLLARHLPIQKVRLLMRHRDIRMTCNLYMDLGLDDLAEEVWTLPPVEKIAGGDNEWELMWEY